MFKQIKFFLALAVSFCFLFEQTGFAQAVSQPNMPAGYIDFVVKDKFRPLHLRSLEFGRDGNAVNLLLDKGDDRGLNAQQLQEKTNQLMEYFRIGLVLPNTAFWVNLRPDTDQDVIDPLLEQTELGKVLLAADLQLKKDIARFTDPETALGREYWEKVYLRAAALYGSDEMTIPTLTRPWIVPGEIIVREGQGSAYIYKATLKVMLEQDYIKDSALFNFSDERARALNEYSSQLIRSMIIPKLTKEVNSSRKYASLRQAYYSLILAQWYKHKVASGSPMQPEFNALINSKDLSGLKSPSSWSRQSYYLAYKKSFAEGEYAKEETLYTDAGPVIRQYVCGGVVIGQGAANVYASNAMQAVPPQYMQARIKGDGGKLETVVDLAKSGLDKGKDMFGSRLSRSADQDGSIDQSGQPRSLMERIKSVDRSQLANIAVSSLFIGITLLFGSPLLAVIPIIMTVYALYKASRGETISGKANAVFWLARVMVIGAVIGSGVGLIGAIGLSLGIAGVMSLSNRGINSDKQAYRVLGIIGIVGSVVFAILIGTHQLDLGSMFDGQAAQDQGAQDQAAQNQAAPDQGAPAHAQQAAQPFHDPQAQPQAPSQWNVDTNGFGSADLNIMPDDGSAPVNVDTNNDGWADINIDHDGDGIPDLNLDTTGDGRADAQIDANGDGIVDSESPIKDAVNTHVDQQGNPDLNVDTNNDKYADINVDTDGDGKADLNIDTNHNGRPDVNVDTNGDRWEGINLDTDGNGSADTNIDTNGDMKADANIDSDGDGVADTKIDPNAQPVEAGGNQGPGQTGGITGQWVAISLAAGTAMGALSKFLNGKNGKTRIIGVSAAVGLSGLALAALAGSGLLISAAVFFGSFVLGYFLLSRLAARSAGKDSTEKPTGPDADRKALEGSSPAQIEGADRKALPAPQPRLPAFGPAAMMDMTESIAQGGAAAGQQQASLRTTIEEMQANGDLAEEEEFTDLRQYWDNGSGLSRGDVVVDYEDGKTVKIILSGAREEGNKIYYDYYNVSEGTFQTMVVNEVPGISYNVKKLRFSQTAEAAATANTENTPAGKGGRFEDVVNQPHAVEVGDVIEHDGRLKRIVGKRNTGAFGIRYDLQDANDPNASIERDVTLDQRILKKWVPEANTQAPVVSTENSLTVTNGQVEDVVNQPHAVEVGDVIEHDGRLKRIVGKRNTGAFGIRYDLQDANDPNASIERDVTLDQRILKKVNADAGLSELDRLEQENQRLQEQIGMATDPAEREQIKEKIRSNIARIRQLQADTNREEDISAPAAAQEEEINLEQQQAATRTERIKAFARAIVEAITARLISIKERITGRLDAELTKIDEQDGLKKELKDAASAALDRARTEVNGHAQRLSQIRENMNPDAQEPNEIGEFRVAAGAAIDSARQQWDESVETIKGKYGDLSEESKASVNNASQSVDAAFEEIRESVGESLREGWENFKGDMKHLAGRQEEPGRQDNPRKDGGENDEEQEVGGIDFRALPVVAQPAAAGLIPLIDAHSWQIALEQSRALDTAREWRRIQASLKKGAVPESAALKKYLAACCRGRDADKQIEQIRICIAQILRIEEDEVLPTSRELEELLLILDSDSPAVTVHKILQQAQEVAVTS